MPVTPHAMVVSQMPSIEPGNPFHSDSFRMGTTLGANCIAMFEKHTTEQQPYIIIVNTDTGERIRIALDLSIHTLG